MSNTARTIPKVVLESVVVTTSDGRVFNLGSPDSPLFRLRVLIYRLKRKLK